MAKKLFLTPAVVKYNYNIFSIKQPWGGEGKVSINFSYLEGGCLLKVGHLLVIR